MRPVVEDLFLQFRRSRDPAVLGEVFDRCADDLFAVALHVANDRAAAEDLVQATFLVAIERAERWQPLRPLQPWLLGILHREAKVQRRRARRRPDEARLAPRDAAPPAQAALDAEAREAVTAALAGVPAPYREVLELHLGQALAPAAIAARLQRSPGAVRTQLWRGLERLRALLPKGLAVGLAAQLSASAPLLAVRARVLEAAATTAATAVGGMVLGTGLLMKKLLAVAVMVVVGVGWLVWWPRQEAEPAVFGVAGSADQVAVVAASPPTPDGAAPSPMPLPARVAAEAEQAAAAPAAGAPATALPPVLLPILVVDRAGDPVEDATVQQFAQATRLGDQGRPEPTGERAERAPPLVQVRTDSRGRAMLTIDAPCLVVADKAELGWSGDHRLDRHVHRLPDALRLVLLPTATVHGVVRLPEGTPAVGATIDAWASHAPSERSGRVPALPSDARGAFTLRVLADEDHHLRARLGDRFTETRSLRAKAGETIEVVLQFPGAFRVLGTLRDAAGQPVRGRVHLHAPPLDPMHGRDWTAACDADGRFQILLAEGGTFELVGGLEGQTSAQQRIVLAAASPHATVELRTQPFVPVEGVVVDERAQPLAGVFVGLSYDVVRDAVHELRSGLHGILARGPSDARGAFRFLVPAGYRYQLGARPLGSNHELFVKGPTFAAPATGLVMVVRDADRRGFEVAARVVADADEAAVPQGRVSVITHEDGGGSSQDAGERFAGGAFRVGPLPAGHRVTLEVTAEGFAGTLVGPFDTTVRTESVVVRLQRCGVVRCRVLRADGTPAVKAWATLVLAGRGPFGPVWQGETDGDGCITFRAVAPGRGTVRAGAVGTNVPGATVDATVRPESTTDVRLTLAK